MRPTRPGILLHATLAVAIVTAAAAPAGAERWRLSAERGSRGEEPRAKADRLARVREVIGRVREELQLYRGEALERASDRLAQGRSDFAARHSVSENLESLVERDGGLEHFYDKVGGREVLHVVVPLGQGKATRRALRELYRRIGTQTVELNFKAPAGRNVFGHIAVRVGSGATYDLLGEPSQGALPGVVRLGLTALTGRTTASLPRRRNLRRFMESREIRAGASGSTFYGYVFAASPAEIKATRRVYEHRLGKVAGFAIEGGDTAAGIYNCAQFLTHALPFWKTRGVAESVGARDVAHDAASSPDLAAVIEYRLPDRAAE